MLLISGSYLRRITGTAAAFNRHRFRALLGGIDTRYSSGNMAPHANFIALQSGRFSAKFSCCNGRRGAHMGQIIQRFDFEGQRGALALPSVLSDAFSPHTFTLQSSLDKGAFFSSAKLGQGALSLFNIPTRTEMSCDATESCFIVFINSGDVIYEIANELFQVHAGQGVIINRGVSFSRRSGPEGMDVTILNLSQAQLRRHLPIEAGDKLQGDIHFSPRFDVSSPLGGTLWRCVQYVQNELISLDSGLDVLENHIVNLENFLIRTVLDTVGRDSSLAGEAIVRNVLPA